MATIGPIDNNQLLSTNNNVQFATLGVGVAPATADVKIAAGNRIGAWITGTNISSGSDADGLFIDTSFQPSANITNAACIGLYPTTAPPGGVTISNAYGLYIASGTTGGAGSVTTGYGLFVTAPTIATTNITAQLDNIRLDSNIIAATNSNGTLSVNSAGTGTLSIGTNATAHATVVGSTTASATTTIQAPSGGVVLTGVQGVAVANKNYVTINTSTGAIGSDAGPSAGVTGPGSSTDRAIATWNGTGGTALFNNSTTKITSGGIMTNTAQPAFFAYLSGNANNVTGAGTTYHIAFDTLEMDQGSNFTTGSSAVFTAPVSGIYAFCWTLSVSDLTVAMTDLLLQLVLSSGSSPQVLRLSPFAIYQGNGTNFSGSTIRQLGATGTAYLALTISGGAGDTADVLGSIAFTSFSGCLLC